MRYRESIEVAAPVEESFAYVADFANAAEWDPGLKESRRLDAGPLRVGSSFHIVAVTRGKEQAFRYAITELEPPARVVIEGSGEKATSRDVVTFEAAAAGGTRITYDLDLRLKGARRLAEPFLGGFVRKLGDSALAGLKRALDGRAG